MVKPAEKWLLQTLDELEFESCISADRQGSEVRGIGMLMALCELMAEDFSADWGPSAESLAEEFRECRASGDIRTMVAKYRARAAAGPLEAAA